MEIEKFTAFKESFIELAKTEYNACDRFIEEVNDAKTILDFKQILHNYVEDIFDYLGGDYDIDNVREHNLELEMYIGQLEDQIEELEKYDVIDTLHDEMKYKTYLELNSKYTPWEFEQLLLNGKL